MTVCIKRHLFRQSKRNVALYSKLVAAGRDVQLLQQGLKEQIYLGDDNSVERMQRQVTTPAVALKKVPKMQITLLRDLQHWLKVCDSRDEALRCVHVDSGISMTAIAGELGLSVARVSQLVARAESARSRPSNDG